MRKYVKGRGAVREWVKLRERNEALDLEVYSLAALQILGQPFIHGLEARAQQYARPLVGTAPPGEPEPGQFRLPRHRAPAVGARELGHRRPWLEDVVRAGGLAQVPSRRTSLSRSSSPNSTVGTRASRIHAGSRRRAREAVGCRPGMFRHPRGGGVDPRRH